MNRRELIMGGAAAVASLAIPTIVIAQDFSEAELAAAGANSDVNPAYVSSHCPSAIEWDFVNKINAYRAQNGVGSLQMSRSLAAAARHHAYYMSRTDSITHTLGSKTWIQNIYDYGYPQGYHIGENVLGGRQSSGGALSLWTTSPAHNANMLDPDWIRIGVGRVYYAAGDYDFYWCTTFGSVSHRTISSC